MGLNLRLSDVKVTPIPPCPLLVFYAEMLSSVLWAAMGVITGNSVDHSTQLNSQFFFFFAGPNGNIFGQNQASFILRRVLMITLKEDINVPPPSGMCVFCGWLSNRGGLQVPMTQASVEFQGAAHVGRKDVHVV